MAKKEKKTNTNFDWINAIQYLDLSQMMKAGLTYYVKVNNLNPKNDKELIKIMNDYKKLPIGE